MKDKLIHDIELKLSMSCPEMDREKIIHCIISCLNDYDVTARETGIEIQNGNGVSWKDVAYLNGKDPGPMTYEQWTYMRNQQVKWVAPQVMACLLLSLHRKYGFGYDRCARIYQQIQDILDEHGNNPERIRKACMQETGINVVDVVTGD